MDGWTGRRIVAVGVAVLVVAGGLGACRRDEGTTRGTGRPGTAAATGTGRRLDPGTFGTLGRVCGPGTARGATARGVTDTTITVGTISDPGYAGRPGLNQELFDVATAFTAWCNAAGGIAGRRLVLDVLDAKVFEARARTLEACERDFALVGGGAALDNTAVADRVACGLPDLPSYVVSPEARRAARLVQPVPNPAGQAPVGDLRWLTARYPGSGTRVAALTANLASTIATSDETVAAARSLGLRVGYEAQYSVLGEPSWTPLASALAERRVRGLLWTGEPANLGLLLGALAAIGYRLDWVSAAQNEYDPQLLATGGAGLGQVYVRTAIVPFEDVPAGSATAEYLALMGAYAPGAKAASALAVQGFSAWLLFARAATACGDRLTAGCLLDTARRVGGTSWTGGGLHAPQPVATQDLSPCATLLEATPDGFTPAPIRTNDGIFACSPRNVVRVGPRRGAP